MATVEIAFTPLPVHVRTARLIATAVARRSGVPESVLDEVRLAVGEACSRAVEAHLRHCPEQPVRVALADDGERFEVVVTDAAPGSDYGLPAGASLPAGIRPPAGTADNTVPQSLPDGVGLAVIAGLADEFHVAPAASAGPGTSVSMSWKRRAVSL